MVSCCLALSNWQDTPTTFSQPLSVCNATTHVTIRGFSFEIAGGGGGSKKKSSSAAANEGAWLEVSEGAQVVLQRVQLTGKQSGIMLHGVSSRATLSDCRIANCKSSGILWPVAVSEELPQGDALRQILSSEAPNPALLSISNTTITSCACAITIHEPGMTRLRPRFHLDSVQFEPLVTVIKKNKKLPPRTVSSPLITVVRTYDHEQFWGSNPFGGIDTDFDDSAMQSLSAPGSVILEQDNDGRHGGDDGDDTDSEC